MIKSILIPVDGSENSKIAVAYAMFFAEFFNAETCGLNVIDIRSLEGPFLSDISASLGFAPFQNYLPKFEQILEERSDLILSSIADIVNKTKIKFRQKKLTGVVSTIISEESKKFDLVVVAQRGEHEQWSTGLLGSTTESVVRKAPRPVLVTPNNFRQIKKVTVAYDGAVESSNALKTACEIFLTNDFEVTVVMVTDDIETKDRLSAEVKEYTAPYNKEVDIVALTGDAGKEILNYAEENGMDLIIMGAFSHGRFHDIILGGTAAYIIRKSTIPVLLNK